MKKNLFIFSILLPLLPIGSEENFTPLSQQAEALWEAHDYATASQIYEQLLSHPLPVWQRARLFYNLGTTRLAQHQAIEAMSFFQKIQPTDLSLPQFGRDLFLNLGIAYLQYAQTLALASTPSFDQQAIFIEQSLQAFDQAHLVDCQMQKEEEKETSFVCHPYPLLDQWIQAARLQLSAVYQQKRQQWIEQANVESLASFLHEHLQDWLDHFTLFQNQENASSKNSSSIPYFQHQLKSFSPIWNALQQKKFSLPQKEAFDQSLALYSNALQALDQQDPSSATQKIKQSIEALAPLNFQENIALQQARLNYEILLLQESLNLSALQRLLVKFNSLEVKQEQVASLEKIKENLKKSIEELQAHHPIQARFFLLASFSPLNSLFKAKDEKPVIILQKALEQANRALQLFFLSEMMPKGSSEQTEISTLLKNQQYDVLVQATPFIPAVLNEQTLRFHEAKNPSVGCQQSPWDQVIPLYDRGYQAAQRAKQQFHQTHLVPQAIISNQTQTIEEWQQALNLLLHPPQQQQQNASGTTSTSTSQNLAETFRLIQEMYLQDQSQPKQKSEELHSW